MTDGMLLVGHGSRSDAGRKELIELGALVAEAVPDIDVEVGFLELTDPPAGTAIDRLVGRGCQRIGVVPLMLNSAGHSRSDVPAVVLEGRRHHPQVTLAYGRPLGVDHALLALAHARVTDRGGDGLPLLVVARGTTEPEANADAYKVARLLAEWSRPPFVQPAFSGLTWPSVPEGLELCRLLGASRVVAFAWYLSTGLLVERMQAQYADFTDHTGIEILDAGYLGPDPSLVPVIIARYLEAMSSHVDLNCDVCSYRAPFPGLEDRVGQPRGVGHSHLAAEHRHEHPPEHPHQYER
jgi:sirohydrochlorin cobaltochelatase